MEAETSETDTNWFQTHNHWISKENLTKSFIIFNSIFALVAIAAGILLEIFLGKEIVLAS